MRRESQSGERDKTSGKIKSKAPLRKTKDKAVLGSPNDRANKPQTHKGGNNKRKLRGLRVRRPLNERLPPYCLHENTQERCRLSLSGGERGPRFVWGVSETNHRATASHTNLACPAQTLATKIASWRVKPSPRPSRSPPTQLATPGGWPISDQCAATCTASLRVNTPSTSKSPAQAKPRRCGSRPGPECRPLAAFAQGRLQLPATRPALS